MFSAIGALEDDLRRLLREYVLPYNTASTALGNFEAKARTRARDDSVVIRDTDEAVLLDYLDLGDEVALLNRHRSFLTEDDSIALRSCNSALEFLVPIRNRVMHGRPLLTADPDDFLAAINSIVNSGLTAIRTREIHERLLVDPTWHPVADIRAAAGERILHNLPPADYDETGLLGRQREVTRLVTMLRRTDRDNVITLVGQGGVGKTAIAVEALYRLIADPECPYETVLWTSLKTEELTGEGVRSLAGAVDSLIEPPASLTNLLDDGGEPTWTWIGEALRDVPALLVIDNAESTNADEIVDIYDQLPTSIALLITSRVGLGQLERRVPVEPLDSSDSAHLLRLYAARRNAPHISSLPRGQLTEIVRRLRNIPLALKWFVLALECGAQPDELLDAQHDLLEFSVKNVVDALSPEAIQVAEALFALGVPASYGELALLVGCGPDALRDAIHTLQRSALVQVHATQGESLGQSYSLTETMTDYLRLVRAPDPEFLSNVQTRAAEVRASEVQRKRYVDERSLDPGTVHCRGESDTAAAFLLSKAVRSSFRGEPEDALQFVSSAAQLAPAYFEVARVRAFVLARAGRVLEASREYEQALDLAAEGEDRAIVEHHFGKHLLREVDDAEQAIDRLERAHGVLGSPVSASELGRALTFAGRYSEAELLLRSAIDGAQGKVKIIALTSWVDLRKRIAEKLLNVDHLPLAGFEQAIEGAGEALKVINAGALDLRLSETTLRCLTEGLRCSLAANAVASLTGSQWDQIALVLTDSSLVVESWRASRYWTHLERQLARLRNIPEVPSQVKTIVEQLVGSELDRAARGRIKFYDHSKGYGFIRPDGPGSDIYFHQSNVRSEDDLPYLGDDVLVVYDTRRDPSGKLVAAGVALELTVDRRELGRGRRGLIMERGLKPNFAFIEDSTNRYPVFVHRNLLRPGELWANLQPGSQVSFDLEIGPRGPLAAAGSVFSLSTERSTHETY